MIIRYQFPDFKTVAPVAYICSLCETKRPFSSSSNDNSRPKTENKTKQNSFKNAQNQIKNKKIQTGCIFVLKSK